MSKHGKQRREYSRCLCDCGSETTTLKDSLKRGRTTSCGCLHKEASITANKTHGRCRSRVWVTWREMLSRVRNPNSPAFKHYGGFLADMGDRPADTSLDRIDNSRGYEPGNCRWASRAEQSRNKRGNVLVTIRGETACVGDWCKRFDIARGCVDYRISTGWDPEAALTTPSKAKKRGINHSNPSV